MNDCIDYAFEPRVLGNESNVLESAGCAQCAPCRLPLAHLVARFLEQVGYRSLDAGVADEILPGARSAVSSLESANTNLRGWKHAFRVPSEQKQASDG